MDMSRTEEHLESRWRDVREALNSDDVMRAKLLAEVQRDQEFREFFQVDDPGEVAQFGGDEDWDRWNQWVRCRRAIVEITGTLLEE